MTYSQDFRQRALDFVNEDHTKAEASRIFNISPTTLKKWEVILKTQGNLKDRPRKSSPRKLPKDDLLAYVNEHPDAYLREIAEHFSCAINAVWKALRKHGITLKKDNHLSRAKFRES